MEQVIEDYVQRLAKSTRSKVHALKYYYGMSLNDVAVITGMSPNTVSLILNGKPITPNQAEKINETYSEFKQRLLDHVEDDITLEDNPYTHIAHVEDTDETD